MGVAAPVASRRAPLQGRLLDLRRNVMLGAIVRRYYCIASVILATQVSGAMVSCAIVIR